MARWPAFSDPRARKLALAGAAVLAILLAWLAGLVWYGATLPDRADPSTAPTDAIVVLTGGSERLAAGIALLRQGLGRKLFVSGVYRGIDVTEILRLARQNSAELDCCVVLGHTADNTRGNAIETAEWMTSERFQSLRLVTASYHMRRALLEFRHAMPDIEIVPYPVFPPAVQSPRWWLAPGSVALIAREYDKFLAAWLRDAVTGTATP